MEHFKFIDILELLAILVAASFGLVGAMTRTRDGSGKLTRWGIVAIIGILVTNSISFVINYQKKLNTANEQIAKAKITAKEDSTKIQEMKVQQGFQDSLIRKTDRSLGEQLEIQRNMNNLFASNKFIARGVNNNLKSQEELIGQQKLLSKNQETTLTDINRGMYRLDHASMHFTVSYGCYDGPFKSFTQQVMDSARACILKTENYQSKILFSDNRSKIKGVYEIRDGMIKITNISIDPSSTLIPMNSNALNRFPVLVCFAQKDFRQPVESIAGADLEYYAGVWNEKNGYEPPSSLQEKETPGNTRYMEYVIWPESGRIAFSASTTRVELTENRTGKMFSLLDLPEAYAKIFFFPPDSTLAKSIKLERLNMWFGNGSLELRFGRQEIEKIDQDKAGFYYRFKKEDIF